MNETLDDIRQLRSYVRVLMRVFLVSERAFAPHEDDLNYNPQDFAVLTALADKGKMRSGAIAKYLGVAPTTASSIIARLRGHNLITTERDANDKRAMLAHLTDKGLLATDRIRDVDERNMALMLSVLDEKERSLFVDAMGRIADRVAELDSAEKE